MKLMNSCNASKTLNASNMETLIECQSEGDIKEHPLLASCESEDSICRLLEVKKRKKVISWPFLMRRLSPSSDFSGASEPELKTSLFDQPLSIVCGDDDTLPRPIQDILAILCLKGPSTEGIFRKAANEKARKELKEELNSGGVVELQSLPVHLLAAVFKDFLRGIPRKLLSWDLFEEWMGALEMQDEEHRIEALKLVADKLPRPNLLLLRHLVSVLHLISKNSEVSKMDASNLAICVGPNMLTRENDQTLSFEAQRDLNNKVKALVEFLIDNCFEIFGEIVPAHSSVASEESLEHVDSSSDTSTLQNDSAYDSNDPDADPSSAMGSPCRPPAVPLEPRGPQRSRQLGQEPAVSTGARLKSSLSELDRRYSEPSMASLQGHLGGPGTDPKLTRSEDDFRRARPASRPDSEDTEDPFPEEVFPAVEGRNQRPQDLTVKNSAQGLGTPQGPAPKTPSSGSLDASLDRLPVVSPSSPKRNFFTQHQSFTKADKSKPNREIKKHSMSFSFASHKKGLSRTPSSGSLKSKSRDPAGKDFKKERQLAGRIIQESLSEAHGQTALDFSSRTFTLSVEDVFHLVDQRHPGSPPSYQEAVQGQALGLAACGSQTVGSMRARMLSLDAGLPPHRPFPHRGDSGNLCGQEPLAGHILSPRTGSWKQSRAVCASGEMTGQATGAGRPEPPRLSTVSLCRQKSQWEYLAQRCSQPAFEADPLPYARESYI
ncbi:T-cell activation Rho GTPase-activating protein [Sturnira hondurensis]|uniref:T-cell activation Rho GTPase-activating protein n=1 Tax=Sturnira hondurensis TaxID=192404 RepID=UPI0018796AF6|nr:T-cell activation Rho GTPase-activating protein [Sturnira hondurensis]XP_036913317.1 T-cell activation Rho GTPase-activating protein [Sturnira hondurensis]